jgi:carboxymethylenebutenolidase
MASRGRVVKGILPGEEETMATITLTAEDGQQLAGYRAAPLRAPRAGLVIVQEIFGVNSHIKRVCDGFAADGYVALAPAIFERVEPGFAIGYKPEDIERGRAVRMKIPLEDMVKDLRAGVKALTADKLKVGVVGYCLGGTLAWLAATRIDGVACAVGYYGGGVADAANERPRCPVLLHFGETDQSIPKEHHERMRAAHPALPMHIYPAGHGFNCDERASYHEPSAVLARSRTLEFLRRHLG